MALEVSQIDTLFDQLGKALHIGDVTNTATQTGGTIATEVEDLIQAIAVTEPVEIHSAVAGAPASTPSMVSAGLGSNTTAVQAPTQNLVIQTIKADQQQPDDGALTAIRALSQQMAASTPPQTLNANEPDVSDVSYGAPFFGDHTGGTSATVMTDSALSLVVDSLIGRIIQNTTDGSSGVVTTNAAGTITVAALTGGGDDQWELNDTYTVIGTTVNSAASGNGVLNTSSKRGDGLVNEHILGETIEGEITSVTATGQASLQFRGESSVGQMSPDWPKGFGGTTTLTSFVGASGANLVTGSFETSDTNEPDMPQGWISAVGIENIGDTLNLTPVEIQTLEITDANITGGYYTITHTDKDGNTQTTGSLVYNAASSAVQSALRLLNGLGAVTVVQSGTTPNLTHTVTFTGVTNPDPLTAETSTITGGTPGSTVIVTTEASANAMRGARAVQFTGIGAPELTAIVQPLLLQPATSYAMSVWIMSDDVPATGEMQIDLVDGITSPNVIADDQDTDNTVTIDITAIDGTYTQYTAFFRTPTVMPNTVYLRVHMSTAIADTDDVFMDEMVLVPAVELYAGGPFCGLFSGPTDWSIGDIITFSPVNDQQGLINTWLNRVFGLAGQRLLIGSALADGETILDSKIS
jgi:hypothetical protein